MDLPNSLMQLSRDTDLVAVRPRGIVIAMNSSHVIIRVGIPRPYRWQPTFGDIIAMDWFVGTIDQVRKQMPAAPEAEAGQ